MFFDSYAARQYPLAANTDGEYSKVTVGNVTFGEGFRIIAGPCAVEAYESLEMTCRAVIDSGADVLRAGAYKPRTSPYSFSGLGRDGIRLLLRAREKYSIPVVTEMTSAEQMPLFDGIDMIQIGARNMQNYDLLRAVGKSSKPVLLKRSFGARLDELLLAAEYILSSGNENVILCERGIRTFEHASRATLDISSVPILKQMTHLPVIVDPSHAAGDASIVEPLALAACAAGADGIMLECHHDPHSSIVDATQTISPEILKSIREKCTEIRKII